MRKDHIGIEMIGIDSNWIGPSKNSVVTFTNITHGEYRFDIGLGEYNAPPKTFKSYSFNIKTPFYAQWWFYFFCVTLLVFVVILIVALRTRQLRLDRTKLEAEVRLRTARIEEQRKLIEYKNDEILASISYASRIQHSILPSDDVINDRFKENFVLYLPKDIVAGDFYWMHETNNDNKHIQYLASADCTGHGVPGAMVSVVCSTALTRSVVDFGLKKASDVLDKTRELVIERLAQGASSLSDGMDIALCAFDLQNRRVEYAGAYNPLWIISSKSDLTEFPEELEQCPGKYFHQIKADKQPVGPYEAQKPFTNHQIELNSDDMLYMFSDGYLDQFGGPNGKKLKSKAFKQLIQEVSALPALHQRKKLDDFFRDWLQGEEQIDDVCVIGIRMP